VPPGGVAEQFEVAEHDDAESREVEACIERTLDDDDRTAPVV
jgi:hypothetical protein